MKVGVISGLSVGVCVASSIGVDVELDSGSGVSVGVTDGDGVTVEVLLTVAVGVLATVAVPVGIDVGAVVGVSVGCTGVVWVGVAGATVVCVDGAVAVSVGRVVEVGALTPDGVWSLPQPAPIRSRLAAASNDTTRNRLVVIAVSPPPIPALLQPRSCDLFSDLVCGIGDPSARRAGVGRRIRGLRSCLRQLPIPPQAEPTPQVRRVQANGIAQVLEGKRQICFLAHEPDLRLAKEPATALVFRKEIGLKAVQGWLRLRRFFSPPPNR